MAVVPDDDDDRGQSNSDEEERQPYRAQTPPTLPIQHEPSRSPLPSPRPMRQRAIAQLRPVSIPNIVCDIAGPDPLRKIADLTGITFRMDSLRMNPRRVGILMRIALS
jgi:hypothetical protein